MARTKRVQEDEAIAGDATHDASPAQTRAPKKKRRRRRGRTSSERGKAFRQRQDNLEALLEQQVGRLQQEVQDTTFLLSVCEAKYQRSRHYVHGPLVARAIEYFGLFQCGLRSNFGSLTSRERHTIQRQEEFVYSIMDPDVLIGSNLRGPQAVLEQWRRLTLASRGLSVEIVAPPIVIGIDESPIMQVQLQTSHRVTTQFIDAVFDPPACIHATHLLEQCMGQTLTLASRVFLQFSRDKRIIWKSIQVDYVQGLLDLGLGLRDVAKLLAISRLTLYS